MHGAIPPLPQYAFMAWCSVKKTAQGQLYFYATDYPVSGLLKHLNTLNKHKFTNTGSKFKQYKSMNVHTTGTKTQKH